MNHKTFIYFLIIYFVLSLQTYSFALIKGDVTQTTTTEQLFEALVRQGGKSFTISLELLKDQGDKALPFLLKKTEHSTWWEKLVAQYVVSVIQEPSLVKSWDRNLRGLNKKYQSNGTVINVRKVYSGTGNRQGRKESFVYDQRVIPFLLVNLHYRSYMFTPTETNLLHEIIAHIGDERAIRPLVFREMPHGGAWKRTLKAYGSKAVPVLRQYLRERNYQWWSGAVAEVLGEIGNRDAIPELIQCVKQGYSDAAVSAAGALCRMKAPEAADTIWPLLYKLALERKLPDPQERITYDNLCSAFGLLGDDLIPYLNNKLNSTDDELTLVMSRGMLARYKNRATFNTFFKSIQTANNWRYMPNPLIFSDDILSEMVVDFLIEEAYIHKNKRVFLHLGTCRQPRAFAALVKGFKYYPEGAIKALGDFGDERALKHLLPIASKQDISSLHKNIDLLAVRAMFKIGGKQTASMIRKAATTNQRIKIEAAVYADLLEGKKQKALNILKSNNAAHRAAAATGLIMYGDLRALPQFLDHLARLRNHDYFTMRSALVAAAKTNPDMLKKLQGHPNIYKRLAVESALMEIEKREDYHACRRDLLQAESIIRTMHVIRYKMIDGAGKSIAQETEPQSIVCFEEALCFSDDSRPNLTGSIAAAVLGYLGQERSLAVLKTSAKLPSHHKTSAVFEALKHFGEKGAQIVRDLPDPNPARPQYSRRVWRSAKAADMLSGLDHEASVQKLLGWYRAWKKSSPAQKDKMPLPSFFDAASKVPDSRLLPILIELFPKGNEYERKKAAYALSSYDDDRVPPLIMSCLSIDSTILNSFTRCVGSKAPQLLVEQFNEAVLRNDKTANTYSSALCRLARGNCLHAKVFDTQEKKDAAAHLARTLAYPAFCKALESPNKDIQCIAAKNLKNLNDESSMKCLCEWINAGGDFLCNKWIVDDLFRSRPPEAQKGIDKAFKNDPSNWQLIKLISAYGVSDNIPEILQQFKKNKGRTRDEALNALGRMGAPGLNELYTIAQEHSDLKIRIRAIKIFSRQKDKRAFDLAVNLYKEIESQDDVRNFNKLIKDLMEVFKISGGKRGKELLMKLGTLHPDVNIRKSALYMIE